MNRWDIDELVERVAVRVPRAVRYAEFLRQWRDIVDENSDGWAYWQGGNRAARPLQIVLTELCHVSRPLTDEDLARLRKALSPIRSCATKHKMPKPVL